MTLTVLLLLAAAAGAAVEAVRSLVRAPRSDSALSRRLDGAGVGVPGKAYVALALAASAGAAALMLALTGGVVPAVAGVVAVAAAATWPVFHSGRRASAHIRTQLPQLADHLADSLAVGMSLSQAFRSASDALGDPLASELRVTGRSMDLGARTSDVLDDMAIRLGEPAAKVLVSAIAVQRESGGDLSGSLSRLALELEERSKLARELQTATAQARMTGGLVAALPIAAGISLELARPGTIGGLIAGPGMLLVAASLAIQGIGLIAIRHVSQIEL